MDRSLGDRQVPGLLRAAGMVVHPMIEVYGPAVAERLRDETWIHDATLRGWVLLHKDTAIARLTGGQPGARLAAIIAAKARSFCVMSASLSAHEQVARILRDRSQIERLVIEEPGPYLYGIYAHGLQRVWPRLERGAGG
jgi:hypothetical protein